MKKLLTIGLLLIIAFSAKAQFNYNNQWAIGAGGGITSYLGYNVTLSAHTTIGKSPHSINFSFNYQNNPLSLEKMNNNLFLADIFYMFSFDNIIKSSLFHLNFGAGGVVGWETINNIPSNISLHQQNGFRYGVLVKVQPEIKVSRTIGIFIEPKYQYLFNAICDNNFSCNVGLKVYL